MASLYQQLLTRISELARRSGDDLQLRGFKTGGAIGQVPVKSGAGDFAWAWGDMTGGGGDLSNVDTIQFDLTPTTNTFSIGETKWNAEEGCLAYGVEGGDISIGKEIWENYTDLDGDIVEGDVVSVAGASGNRSAVRKTDATSATSAAAVLGIVTNVNADNTVRVTEFGRVHKLNTNGYTEGAVLYVNPAANGKWTDVKPTAPNYAVEIGVVEVAHAVNGVVAARCRSVTFPSANIIDLSSATVGALSFGASAEAVSMSAVAGVATFTFGSNAKAAFLAAVGAMASTGGTMTNGTIAGTLTINSTSITFGAGAAAEMLTKLGVGTTGKSIFESATQAAAQTAIGLTPIGFAIRNTGSGGTPAMTANVLTKVPMTDQETLWNGGGGWNLATGVFTAPVAGIYLFSGVINAVIADQKRLITALYKNGALHGILGRGGASSAAGTTCGFGGSMQVVAAANDTFELYYFQDDAAGILILNLGGYVHFSALLVSRL